MALSIARRASVGPVPMNTEAWISIEKQHMALSVEPFPKKYHCRDCSLLKSHPPFLEEPVGTAGCLVLPYSPAVLYNCTHKLSVRFDGPVFLFWGPREFDLSS